MKTIISLVVLLAVQSAWCFSSDFLKTYLKYTTWENVLKMYENFCPGYRNEFVVAFNESENCWLAAHEGQTLCARVKSHVSKCFEPIQKVLSECLPEKSRTIPKIFTDIIVPVADHICKTDGEHLLELVNKCAWVRTYKSERCQRMIISRLEHPKIRSYSENCEFFRSLKGCVESHLNASCGSKITREAFMDIFNVILRKCDDSETYDGNEVDRDSWNSQKGNVDYKVPDVVQI